LESFVGYKQRVKSDEMAKYVGEAAQSNAKNVTDEHWLCKNTYHNQTKFKHDSYTR
jgi:hypothetical protein